MTLNWQQPALCGKDSMENRVRIAVTLCAAPVLFHSEGEWL